MPPRPRFAYLFKRFPVFAQTFIVREVEGMARHGCRPKIYALQSPGSSEQEGFAELRRQVSLVPSGVALGLGVLRAGIEGQLPAAPFVTGAWLGRGSRRRREAFWLGPRLRPAGIAHVHTHFTGPAARTAWSLLKDFGISYSITAHANDFLSDADEYPGMERLMADAAFVVAVSDYSRRLLLEKYPGVNIVRIYNGMDLNSALPSAPASPPRLLSVGRLVEKKGYPILIEACRLLREQGIDFRCRIIGEGPMHDELKEQIAACSLAPIVELAGPQAQPEIRRSLGEASLFVLPCVEERSGGMDILPTVITEAMAARLPVVSTRLAGIPEMVLDGKTGRLVASGDAAAIASAVRGLLSQPDQARSMGEAGRRHAEEMFSEGVTIPQLVALLQSMNATPVQALA